jgi:hypothetical protein
VDPVTGAVTQPDTLPVCGATLARRRGYVAAALAAQAAAATLVRLPVHCFEANQA